MSDGVCDQDGNRNQSEHSQNRSSALAHSKSDTGQGRKRSKGGGVRPPPADEPSPHAAGITVEPISDSGSISPVSEETAPVRILEDLLSM